MFTPETFINALPAYDTYTGNILKLDFARELVKTGTDYFYKGWASPSKNPSLLGNGYSLDPYQTFEEVINIPVGSFLISMATYSSLATSGYHGFAWNVEEVDSETNMVIGNSQLGEMVGNFQSPSFGLPTENEPIGPTWTGRYFCIGERSLIKVTLINLANEVNYVQLYMDWAVPVSKITMNRQVVN